MWYVRDVLYAVFYVRVRCFVVCRCAVLRRYIDVCNCDMFSVVNVCLDHLKFCVVCITGRRYVCCGECYVVSDECDEPTSCLVQPIGAHCCDDICICGVNKQFFLHMLSRSSIMARISAGSSSGDMMGSSLQ